MYKIYYGAYVLHNPNTDDVRVINAELILELNKTGSLKFSVLPTHPKYDLFNSPDGVILVYQDDVKIFEGRVLNLEYDVNNIIYVECEGALSYLLDSIQRPHALTQNIRYALLNMLDKHNESTVQDGWKHILLGETVYSNTESVDYVYNGETTLNAIQNKILNVYGGYITITYNDDGDKYLNYYDVLPNISNQTIEFGSNLIDINRFVKRENVFTALIPYGKKSFDDEDVNWEIRVGIDDLPDCVDGSIHKVDDYIYDENAVNEYGWIYKCIKWDEIENVDTLYSVAKAELQNGIQSTIEIKLNAVDLHLLDVDIDAFRLGDKVRCISTPHNIDAFFIVKSLNINIDDPSSTSITLIAENTKFINEVSITDKVQTDSETTDTKASNSDFNNLKNWVSDNFARKNFTDGGSPVDLSNYAKKSDLGSYAKTADVDTKINDLKDWTNTNYQSKIDLSEYAKIDDVNTAFGELATALEGV